MRLLMGRTFYLEEDNMKKIIAIVVLLSVVFSLVACNTSNTSTSDCDNCGENISNNVKFCPHCGEPINSSNNSDNNLESDDSSQKENNNPTDNNNTDETTDNSQTDSPNDNNNNETEDNQGNETPAPPDLIKERVKIYGTYIHVNSADGVSVYIQWENLSQKEIKYIYFKTELYNRVNDLLSCDVSDDEAQWLYQTGPIPQGKGMYNCISVSSSNGGDRPFRPDVSYSEYKEDEENGWEGQYWDCIWYNSQAYYVKIVGIEIEYMDGTVFSETNRSVFEQLDIINLNINQPAYNYTWVYPTSAKLMAKDFPYSSDNVYIESLIIDSVEGVEENEALFVCRVKGYSYEWGVELSMKVVDQYGNRVDDYISTSTIITEEGNFTSDEFYVTTPIDGTYYLVIEFDY